MGIAYIDQLNNFMQGDVCEYCGCSAFEECDCWQNTVQEDEVHPMYCSICGAEYGEDWVQCDCWDNTGLEVES